jgi:ribonucleotide reductase alpha subunit
VENHVVRCLRVERFLDFRVRRHADVREDEEEEKEVEELVRNGVKKEFSPHFRVFLNNARTRSGERRTNFLTEESREKEEKLFICFWPKKPKR